MDSTVTIIVLLYGRLMCSLASVLHERMMYDLVDASENIRFNLSNVAANSEPLQIVFNTQFTAAEADRQHGTSRSRQFNYAGSNDEVTFEYEETVFLAAQRLNDHCVKFMYATTIGSILTATIDTKNIHLYGGAEDVNLEWPYDKMHYDFTPYITQARWGRSVLEPYWLTSTGFFIYVDQSIPLFLELDPEDGILKLSAINDAPYVKQGSETIFNFTVCNFENARIAHQYAVEHYLGKPNAIPDVRRVYEPIWSTMGRYGNVIDADKVRSFAADIRYFGYGGQIEIDGDWEDCFGSLTINENHFENLKALVGEIKIMNLRVAIWVHPFMNTNCLSLDASDSFFVSSVSGNRVTQWWNGDAFLIDFTNPEASNWFRQRLFTLLEDYGLDGLNFDAGESSYLPFPANFTNTDDFYPETNVRNYVQLIASLNNGNVHMRVARGMQKYPIFITMRERDSSWTGPSALSTLIPQLLQLNILGYSFVLPGAVGGTYGNDGDNNGYYDAELFIRWLQASVFMPSMQFSLPPWHFDEKTELISKKFIDLHGKYADEIIRLMHRHVEYGDPVNPPIWWIAPNDPNALECDSEYLLGENLLVAPVLTKGATERDVYLPAGTWRDENHPSEAPRIGPIWVRGYSADIGVLPYFTRIINDEETMQTTHKVRGKSYTLWLIALVLLISMATLYLIYVKRFDVLKFLLGWILRPA